MKFEPYKLFNNEVLFTDLRINKDYLPKNIYRYELRHDDESQGIMCEITPSIMVNFWGTILSNKPIQMEEHCSRFIDEDKDIEYLDKPNITLQEYLKQQKAKQRKVR